MRRRASLLLAFVLSLQVARCEPAGAAGPLIVNGVGQPLVWNTRPIPYNPDQGTLGMLANSNAVSFVAARFATWTGVPTASISFVNAGALPADVTGVNATAYFGVCGDNLNPIIFDSDGSVIRTLFGVGQENVILGASGPDCASYVPPVITEASAILNGRFIDGTTSQVNPEVSLADFAGVFTHEFGHYIGLDHSQINLTEAFDSNTANDNTIATMFPILINGSEQASLNLDDRVAASMLYPSANFYSSTGSIRGSVLRADGATPFQGAYVIAREIGNPRINAVGTASGFLFEPGQPGGPPAPSLKGYYQLDGLTAGTSYTVGVEPIDSRFTGGSSVGPLSPPAALSVPEFWNGANEAATNPPDNPSAATAVPVSAGNPVTGINIILNTVSGTMPSNDLCTQAKLVSALPFNDTEDTTGASESAGDPGQACANGSKNSNTVWYAIVPPDDGILTIDTCGSNYDTVVTVFTGDCSALSPLACNDDVGADNVCSPTQSRLSTSVFAGQTYLLEVSQFGAPAGGNLVMHATLGPRNCDGGDCVPGRGAKATDCIAEWRVEPPGSFTRPSSAKVDCRDGDLCDGDDDPTNHSCTFHLAVCLNNHDPALATCTPTGTAVVEVVKPDRNSPRNKPQDTVNGDALLSAIAGIGSAGTVNGICKNRVVAPNCTINADCNSPGKNNGRCYRFVRFVPSFGLGDRCTHAADVVVPQAVRTNGTFRTGSKGVRLKSTSSTGVIDRDVLTLRCVPSS